MSLGMEAKQTAVMIGGSGAIGSAAAQRFLKEGYNVVIVGSTAPSVGNAEQDLKAQFPDSGILAIRADIRDSGEVAKMIAGICAGFDSNRSSVSLADVVAKFGRIDVCCNGAGAWQPYSHLHEIPEECFDHVVSVNLKAVWTCMKFEIQQMLEQTPFYPSDPLRANIRGRIVNVSSTAGQLPIPMFSAYCSSKWGLLGLTRSAAYEYASSRIQINAILPSTTDTPMLSKFLENKQDAARCHAIQRICTPAEVAEAIYWLGSCACPFMQGECVTLSGALKLP